MTAINQGFMTFHRLTSSPLLLDSSHPIFVQKNEYLFLAKQSKCFCLLWPSFRLRKDKQYLSKYEGQKVVQIKVPKFPRWWTLATLLQTSPIQQQSLKSHPDLCIWGCMQYTVSLKLVHLFWKYLLVIEFPPSLLWFKKSSCMASCVARTFKPGSL